MVTDWGSTSTTLNIELLTIWHTGFVGGSHETTFYSPPVPRHTHTHTHKDRRMLICWSTVFLSIEVMGCIWAEMGELPRGFLLERISPLLAPLCVKWILKQHDGPALQCKAFPPLVYWLSRLIPIGQVQYCLQPPGHAPWLREPFRSCGCQFHVCFNDTFEMFTCIY